MFSPPRETVGVEDAAKWNLSMRSMHFFNMHWPEPKRTHKPAVQVLLIKMGSVLSSVLFSRFLPKMYGLRPSLSFPRIPCLHHVLLLITNTWFNFCRRRTDITANTGKQWDCFFHLNVHLKKHSTEKYDYFYTLYSCSIHTLHSEAI